MPRPYATATAMPFLYAGQAVVISDAYKPLALSNGLDVDAVYEIQKVNPKTITFKKPNGRTAKWSHNAFTATDREFVLTVEEVAFTLGQVVTFDHEPGKLFAIIKPGTSAGSYNIAAVEDSGDRYYRSVASVRLAPVRITSYEEV